jgi:CheY-like chemotaxis protein
MSVFSQILLVEDDAFLSTFMKMVLEEEGYTVAVAGNGQEALDILSNVGLPDLIMFDIKMPVMDGKEFASAFRRLYNGVRPLVVMTAADDAEKRAQELGVTTCLAKPFGIPELIATVKEQLRA